jgi:MYXO-CTERM domain-containing protein
MNRPRRGSAVLVIAGCLALLAEASASADIPAGYTGTPYMGPQAIPGRVELANLDLGGQGVAWAADHSRANSVTPTCNPPDYRPTDMNLPDICKTNTPAPEDHWVDGGVYPSATDLYWHYIGLAHAHDWVRCTVDVKQAGTYSVSSNWASPNPTLGLSIWFNDGHSPVDPTHPTDGVNKTGIVKLKATNDYHIWDTYPQFATVQLSAGLQVMTFHLELYDHLQYGFLQFDPVGGADAGGGPAGTGDAGLGQDDAGVGDGSSGAASSSGAVASAGATSGMAAGGSGTSVGTSGAGASSGTGSASGNVAGSGTVGISSGRGGAPAPYNSQGCACSVTPRRGAGGASPLFALGGALLLRRRRPRAGSRRRPTVHAAIRYS